MDRQHLTRRRFLKGAGVLLGTALLQACTPQQAPPASKEEPTAQGSSEKVSTVAPAAAPVKLLVWDDAYGSDAAGTPDAQRLDALHKNFIDGHPDIEVDWQALPAGTEIRKTFIEANAAGTPPDLFFTYVPSMNPYIEQGFLLQMDEYVQAWPQKDKVYEPLWVEALIDGHYYGVPHADAWYGMTLLYRKDLFAAEGLDRAPADWNEIVEFGKKLTKPDKNQHGYGLLGMAWASWYWENFVWQAGGEVTKRLPDGKVELSFTDDAGVAALQFYQDLKYEHQITQTDVMQDYDANKTDLLEGRTAMYMDSVGGYGWYYERGLTQDNLGNAILPAGPAGVKAAQVGGGYWTISPAYSRERQQAAWAYILWRNDPQTLIFDWQTCEKVGRVPGVSLPVYKDLNQTEYKKVPEEFAKVAEETAAIARMEYIFKDKLEPYLAVPVQQVLTDGKADCKTALVECAKKVVKEVQGTVLAASAQG